jgi:hypothetical protein
MFGQILWFEAGKYEFATLVIRRYTNGHSFVPSVIEKMNLRRFDCGCGIHSVEKQCSFVIRFAQYVSWESMQ